MTELLGSLTRLDPRSVWPHEALNFTPWLAEHLDLLAGVLGLELELVDQEAPIGDFSADVIAKDLGSQRLVLIENQLAPTDHSHLGQLLTYAAGLDARVIVWVSPEFREEHRQALDWLNRGHGTATDFFGAVVEVVQIDGSKPAANFRLVAAPNDWSRRQRPKPRDGELSSKQERYREFFQGVIDELREKHRFTNARASQPQNWFSFTSGHRGFTYAISFALRGRLRTELYIDTGDGDHNDRAFRSLYADREELSRELGDELEWEALDGKRACRVACYRDGTIEDSSEQLEEYHSWVVDRVLRFKKIFDSRIRALDLSD